MDFKKLTKKLPKFNLNSIKQKLSVVLDIFMIFLALFLAGLEEVLVKSEQQNSIKTTFQAPQKSGSKKSKIPRSQLITGEAYELTPKKTIKRYKAVNSAYGKYLAKRKHPLVKYHAQFYLDPNSASKSLTIKVPIYIMIQGQIVKASTKQINSQRNFINNSSLAFSNTHFVLNDSLKYIHVMQFVNYQSFNGKPIPNANTNNFTVNSNIGISRYIRLDEFKIKRLKKVSLSSLADKKQLFCGYKAN